MSIDEYFDWENGLDIEKDDFPWENEMAEREKLHLDFCYKYATEYGHGISGHHSCILIAKLDVLLNIAQGIISGKSDKIEDLENEVEALQGELDSHIKDSNIEISELKDQIEDLKYDHREEIDELQKELDDYRSAYG